jgi:hypothetical protein
MVDMPHLILNSSKQLESHEKYVTRKCNINPFLDTWLTFTRMLEQTSQCNFLCAQRWIQGLSCTWMSNRYYFRAHFAFWHWNDKVIIHKESLFPHYNTNCLLLGKNAHTALPIKLLLKHAWKVQPWHLHCIHIILMVLEQNPFWGADIYLNNMIMMNLMDTPVITNKSFII